jgi:hypothetical protein
MAACTDDRHISPPSTLNELQDIRCHTTRRRHLETGDLAGCAQRLTAITLCVHGR